MMISHTVFKQISLVVILAALSAFLALPASSEETSYRVTTATATSVEFTPSLSAFGVVEPDPRHVSTLVSMINGTVQRVDVRPGQPIAEGDAPITLFTDPAVKSQVIQAQAAVRLADETLQRIQSLEEKGLLPKTDLDTAQRDFADASATLAQLKASGALDPVVRPAAPAAGIVTDVLVKIGDQVPAGTALLQTADPTALIVRIGVEAADVTALSIGMPIIITALTGLEPGDPQAPRTTSTVSAIEYLIDPQTRLVRVSAEISGQEAGGFLINQAVRAYFEHEKVATIRVPRAALTYDGRSPVIFVDAQNKAVRREVTLVEATDDWVYLSGGVSEGEQVITSGQTGLPAGALLKIVK